MLIKIVLPESHNRKGTTKTMINILIPTLYIQM